MIKLQDRDDFKVFISVPGTQTTGKKYVFVMPFAGWLKAVYSKLGTAGVTGTQTVDINKGGSSVLGTLITFATTNVDPNLAAVFTADPTSFAKGDFVSVDVDAIHSGTAAIDLSVALVFSRNKPAGIIQGAIEVSVGKGF
ncbi:hypothetical protein LCGC14_1002070 [marine sediment metagenome]|uniref:Uncharacterized protein n=1 Tax=marine sediment metagenome TaxID=412755 RepID=A0A0F9QL78_9ZZZZ